MTDLLKWGEFKTFIDAVSPDVFYYEYDGMDNIIASINGLTLRCNMRLDASDADVLDWQTNYRPNANRPFKKPSPFKEKRVDGKKLFRRKHGYSLNVPANSTTTLVVTVPYAHCKINEVEIIPGNAGDAVDFAVHDTLAGTYSTVPDYLLNQFGFNVTLPPTIYTDASSYDADLYQDMRIKIHYTNTDLVNAIDAYFNLVFHEVVS